jgi:hypothetical protein
MRRSNPSVIYPPLSNLDALNAAREVFDTLRHALYHAVMADMFARLLVVEIIKATPPHDQDAVAKSGESLSLSKEGLTNRTYNAIGQQAHLTGFFVALDGVLDNRLDVYLDTKERECLATKNREGYLQAKKGRELLADIHDVGWFKQFKEFRNKATHQRHLPITLHAVQVNQNLIARPTFPAQGNPAFEEQLKFYLLNVIQFALGLISDEDAKLPEGFFIFDNWKIDVTLNAKMAFTKIG